MNNVKDIVLVVDYHDKNLEFRRFDADSGEEQTFRRPTTALVITSVVNEARSVAEARGGQVVWIMQSTTGWARVQQIVDADAVFQLVNVLQDG